MPLSSALAVSVSTGWSQIGHRNFEWFGNAVKRDTKRVCCRGWCATTDLVSDPMNLGAPEISGRGAYRQLKPCRALCKTKMRKAGEMFRKPCKSVGLKLGGLTFASSSGLNCLHLSVFNDHPCNRRYSENFSRFFPNPFKKGA